MSYLIYVFWLCFYSIILKSHYEFLQLIIYLIVHLSIHFFKYSFIQLLTKIFIHSFYYSFINYSVMQKYISMDQHNYVQSRESRFNTYPVSSCGNDHFIESHEFFHYSHTALRRCYVSAGHTILQGSL